jgi:hypothetical protein
LEIPINASELTVELLSQDSLQNIQDLLGDANVKRTRQAIQLAALVSPLLVLLPKDLTKEALCCEELLLVSPSP